MIIKPDRKRKLAAANSGGPTPATRLIKGLRSQLKRRVSEASCGSASSRGHSPDDSVRQRSGERGASSASAQRVPSPGAKRKTVKRSNCTEAKLDFTPDKQQRPADALVASILADQGPDMLPMWSESVRI